MNLDGKFVRRVSLKDIFRSGDRNNKDKLYNPFEDYGTVSRPISAFHIPGDNKICKERNFVEPKEIENFETYTLMNFSKSPYDGWLDLSLSKPNEHRMSTKMFRLTGAKFVRVYEVDEFHRDIEIRVEYGRVRIRYLLELL